MPDGTSETSWGDLLAEARRALAAPAFAPFEAEELLARAAGRPRAWFHGRRREVAEEGAGRRFRALLARRLAGEPLQYLLGEWEFLGRTFRVDARALIPRGETEVVVEAARERAPHARRILDAGTGSGILAVTLALLGPEASVVGVDRSPEALFLARENARAHGVASRVGLVGSDWLRAFAPRSGFDLAVANPPYVPLEDAPHVEKTVSEHEPGLALWGGIDGLDPLRRLVADLPAFVRPGGFFVFEFGYGQAAAVSDLFASSRAFALEEIRLDRAGIPRTGVASRR